MTDPLPTSRGMPRSRNSFLSRSNIRENASALGLSEYPATVDLILSAVMGPRVDRRGMTRLPSRSTFEVAICSRLDGPHRARAPTGRHHIGHTSHTSHV